MKKKAEIINIPIGAILPSPRNPRKTFDEADLKELADNIKQQGLLQPITVRPTLDGCYEIVCGERRYRAWCLLVKDGGQVSVEIPSIVREMTDEDAFYAMVTENLQRKDVDPIEEAFAFGELAKMGKSIEEIANRFGKSKRFIADRIKLGNLIPEMKEWVTKGLMDIGAALHMAKLPEETQREALDNWDPDDVDDPVTKKDALDFTDRLFMRIDRAPWKEDFEGSCRCACDKCEFNNSNAGCLFYEMKINREDACCTNRDRFQAKRLDWLKHIIDEKADVLVKDGDQLEAGKMVVAFTNDYGTESEEYTSLIEHVKGQGYKLVKCDAMFERWSHYGEQDERLQAKIDKGEVYRVLLIANTYLDATVRFKYYEFKKQPTEEDKDGAEAMQLVQKRKENISKSKGDVAIAMQEIVKEFDTHSLAWKGISDTEWAIILELIFQSVPYTMKEELKGEATVDGYIESINNPDGRDKFFRDFMRYKLGSRDVQFYGYLQTMQSKLIDEWGIDATEARTRAAEKLAKRNEKIDKRLLELGYDTEGKKLAF